MVYLLPFSSCLAGPKGVSALLYGLGTMTITALEAIASSSGKDTNRVHLRTHWMAVNCKVMPRTILQLSSKPLLNIICSVVERPDYHCGNTLFLSIVSIPRDHYSSGQCVTQWVSPSFRDCVAFFKAKHRVTKFYRHTHADLP